MLQQPTNALHDLGSDISVTTPSVTGEITPPLAHEQTVKAKQRLETICTLLSSERPLAKGQEDKMSKQKQQEGLLFLFEEILQNQSNKFDSQSLRLLMDWQNQATNEKSEKLREELAELKARFDQQRKIMEENKALRERVRAQDEAVKERDRVIRKLERECANLKAVASVAKEDREETRIRGMKERCASQQNRRSSTLVPKLDLSKVRPYQDKEQAKVQQKALAQQKKMQSQSLQSSQVSHVPYKQMQTLQPTSSVSPNAPGADVKLNNFVGETDFISINELSHQQKVVEKHLSQSLSLSPPKSKGKRASTNQLGQSLGGLHDFGAQLRHSVENAPTAQQLYNENSAVSRGRQQHHFSSTIEANSSGVDYEQHSERKQQRFNERKRSMPPANVHIPLLDFSKLHQPQQPAQARGQKAMQPKQYQSLQPKYAESKNHHLYVQSLQQNSKTQPQATQQPYQKKRNSYELYSNSQKQQMNNSNGLWAGNGNTSTQSINQQILLKGAHEQSSTPAYQSHANGHQHSTSTSGCNSASLTHSKQQMAKAAHSKYQNSIPTQLYSDQT